jgi:hypothetical protein
MELVIWGLLIGMVGMVWFLAAAALMEREHHSEEHDPPKTNPEHHDHAPTSVSTHDRKRVAA